MTAVVSQLADLGFAERRPDCADGRVVLVAITQAGLHHLRATRRAGASVFTVLIDKLTEQEVAALSAAWPALRRLMELAAESPTVRRASQVRQQRLPRARAVRRRAALTGTAVDAEVIV